MAITKPHYWDDAKKHLSMQDALLGSIISSYHDDEHLAKKYTPFITLAKAITGQQISVHAADAIWARLSSVCNDHIAPEKLITVCADELRAIGYSRQKVNYLNSLCQATLDGHIDSHTLKKMDDKQVISHLTKLKGIGPWSAEMFLIFQLERPNILPLGDIGLINAIKKHYNCTDDAIEAISNKWSPYRTVATWYLWRSLDPTTVSY